MSATNGNHQIPDWAFAFHGHRCPFMPIGYRLGQAAMARLGMERESDHGAFVFSEMGEGHPQACMMDGIQAATGCTYGKNMLTRLNYGKVAAVVYHPQKGAIRVALRPEVADEMGKYEFFALRKKGIEPSAIPGNLAEEVVNYVLSLTDDALFTLTPLADFHYAPTPSSFNKVKCSHCGEYVFERYIRTQNGQPVCIPCSGFEKNRAKLPEL